MWQQQVLDYLLSPSTLCRKHDLELTAPPEEDVLSTAELMEHFYHGMLKRRLRPAAALRAAQLEMMKKKRWTSPYFWAAFVIQGEWR